MNAILIALAVLTPREVTLSEAMEAGATAPTVLEARARAEAAGSASDIEWRQALLPTVAGQASVLRRDRNLTLDTGTPLGAFEFGPTSVTRAAVVVTQPVLDPARLFFNAPAASDDARAAELLAERARELGALNAAERFFDVLVIDARIEAIDSLVESLQAQAERVARLMEVGRALEVDALRVQLALDDAKQARTELQETRAVACFALGQAMGIDDAVQPRGDSSLALPDLPAPDRAAELAREQRRDLRALRSRAEAVGARVSGVWAELVPTLNVSGAYIYDDGAPWDQEDYLEGSLNLSWVPFASATRPARANVLRAERSQIEAQLLEARRGVAIEARRAVASFNTALSEIEVARRGVRQAAETLRVEKERYEGGRALIIEVLNAEAIASERAARLSVALVEIARAKARGWAALGRVFEMEGRAD